jgi:hypothetical protein
MQKSSQKEAKVTKERVGEHVTSLRHPPSLRYGATRGYGSPGV